MNVKDSVCIIGAQKFLGSKWIEDFLLSRIDRSYKTIILGSYEDFKYLKGITKDLFIVDSIDLFEDITNREISEDIKLNLIISSEWRKRFFDKHQDKLTIEEILEKTVNLIFNDGRLKANKVNLISKINILNFPIQYIEEIFNFYDKIIFEDQHESQIIDVNEIHNLKFLLKIIQKAKKDGDILINKKEELKQINRMLIDVASEEELNFKIKKLFNMLMQISKSSGAFLKIDLGVDWIKYESNFDENIRHESFEILAFDKPVGNIVLNYPMEQEWVKFICKILGDIVVIFLESEERKNIKQSNQKVQILGEILGGIIHDLNNIFSVIKGYSQLLELKSEDSNIFLNIKNIQKETQKSAYKIKMLQEFSKEIKEDKKSVLLEDVLKEAIETVRPKWEIEACLNKRVIDLQLDFTGKQKIFVKPSEIKVSIINILLNAVDALENGGYIRIRTIDGPNWVLMQIQDSGIGMSKKQLENIFKPFYTNKESTGLGLTIAKRNIENNLGFMRVSSQISIGTTFTIGFKPIENY